MTSTSVTRPSPISGAVKQLPSQHKSSPREPQNRHRRRRTSEMPSPPSRHSKRAAAIWRIQSSQGCVSVWRRWSGRGRFMGRRGSVWTPSDHGRIERATRGDTARCDTARRPGTHGRWDAPPAAAAACYSQHRRHTHGPKCPGGE